jgi:hypothetical protein
MPYPQIVEYNDAVQNPAQAFIDSELKQGLVEENNLGLPHVLSGGFALTYTLSTSRKKYAVRCFKREIPSIEQKYNAISKKLRSLSNGYFVNFDFQKPGIKVRQSTFPIVKMDWVEGDPLYVWLDKNFDNAPALQKARADFSAMAAFLEREGIAHGDIQNGNVMLSNGAVKLIDYDGMFVPGMPKGNGSETGHRHFQHPNREASNFGPTMDRFSFIALDLSLQAIIENKALYKKFREGGETIVFKANDFDDPQSSEIFRLLLGEPKLRDQARNFAAICEADIAAVPTLADFLAAKDIPAVKPTILTSPVVNMSPRGFGYIAAYPVVNALDFAAASRHVGDRVELIGKIIEVKPGVGRWAKAKGQPYIFINFGPWKGSIVKISIWSEGLKKLREKPSNSWIGRWVSVTGLVDPPYRSRRYRYTHLSITIQEEGQIQQLDEGQARFRLASVGKETPRRNRDIVSAVTGASRGATAPKPLSSLTTGAPAAGSRNPTSTTGSPAVARGGSTSRNKKIVAQIKKQSQPKPITPPTVPRPITAPTVPKQPVPQPLRQGSLAHVPSWMWVVGIVALLILLISLGRPNPPASNNRPSAAPSSSKPVITAAPSAPVSTQPAPIPYDVPFGSNPVTTAILPPRESVQPTPIAPPEVPDTGSGLRQPEPSTVSPTQEPTTPKVIRPILPTSEDHPSSVAPPIALSPPPVTAPGTDTTATPTFPTPLLDLGQIEDAKRVQQRLIDLGFLFGTADGIWGPRSRRAIQEFRIAQAIGDGDTWDHRTEQELFSTAAAPTTASVPIDDFVGGWGIDVNQCRQVQSGRSPLTISPRRAEAFGAVCDFGSVQRDSPNVWRVQATCTHQGERWLANVRLTIVGNKLTWSSERGTVTYLRCTGP